MKHRVVTLIRIVINYLFAVGLVAHANADSGLRMHGAGSTFVYPLFSKWFSVYQKERDQTLINYQSIGSGGGIRQLIDGTVDFGATDIPMNEEQLKKASREVYHFPVTMGAVVVTYSVAELTSELRLTPQVIADIFLGKIVKWNAPEIVALNPGLALPARYITVVHRSDGSGTTAVFAEFLSKTNPEWKEKVGTGTALQWPTGLGGKGNEGVTGLIKSLKDTIGYVELTFALSQKLPVALVKNPEGEWIKPSLESVLVAAANMLRTIPDDFRFTITAAQGSGSYPISGMSFYLLDSRLKREKLEKWNESLKLLRWMLGAGQEYSQALHYARIPKPLSEKMLRRLTDLEKVRK
ncbi:MAG: phosphate ABC transporter substrate-binding protein PstS [Xanthomonadaceae bacterium]|nr:phosphate ABC transporter substrate-binding protein PstS [Xanthomonadaceae bacterium]